MPSREIIPDPHYYYHVYNRVSNQIKLFTSKENYLYCIRLIRRYALKYNIDIIAYCLMPNHYHMLVFLNKADSLSKFIGVLFNTYVQAFNKQQKRKGPLFTDRFKNVLIEKEEYILHLCRYIHLNPVKANLVKTPEDWKFSDCCDWIGRKHLRSYQISFIRDYFSDSEFYREFISDYNDTEQVEKLMNQYYFDSD